MVKSSSFFCSLQKKLEQLLLKFPPEEVESKRWQKIADELGNRTAKQVLSPLSPYTSTLRWRLGHVPSASK